MRPLPFGQVVSVLAGLSGLTVSRGGVARQLRRLGDWLDPYCERVKLALNGSILAEKTALSAKDGDEIALLPPVSGG